MNCIRSISHEFNALITHPDLLSIKQRIFSSPGLICAIPVIGQVACILMVPQRREMPEAQLSDTMHTVTETIESFEEIQQAEKAALIGSLFQVAITLGLAKVLQWSVFGISGVVLAIGLSVTLLCWKWSTSRLMNSAKAVHDEKVSQYIQDKYKTWKIDFVKNEVPQPDSGEKLIRCFNYYQKCYGASKTALNQAQGKAEALKEALEKTNNVETDLKLKSLFSELDQAMTAYSSQFTNNRK